MLGEEVPKHLGHNLKSLKGCIYGIGDQANAKIAYEIALETLTPGSFAYDFTKMKSEQINQEMRIKTTNHNEYENRIQTPFFFYEACYSAWSISIYSRCSFFGGMKKRHLISQQSWLFLLLCWM
ncbi:MAG: hypothetical protein Ct9H90mP13_02640 [Pseudomonadota bacterium]|nr:MAG: hypothetical protein Ct9H90mP13_02640 [Pseudomonadota bacterium]